MNPLESMAPDWPKISVLLDELLSLPEAERDAWIDALHDERARFKDTLRRLMMASGSVETGDFLNHLPRLRHVGAPAASEAAVAGALVGPYRLLTELGHGGMGTVWLAERADGQIKRQVALKLPRMAWDGSLAERLVRERDILGSLEHPNIARLYDAGTDRHGRPYLAMEHVEGLPIDNYIRTHALDVRARLALLLQVCAAVAHAHAQLVVHRDLKPGNILVTPQGQVRLLDFGIAKVMEGDRTQETALTRLSGRALSPDYASPEQIRGDAIGTASDVYSLAVVAFELLAGQPPYRLKRGSAAEREEAIALADPPRASDVAASSGLKKQLRGDLDAILNKALKKAPADRYPTMSALADDIERHLDGRPVHARPERRLYLARKFIGRHRVGVTALGAVIVALGAGLAVALWQTQVAQRNEQTAEAAVEREGAVKMLMMDTLAVVAGAGKPDLQTPAAVARTMRARLEDYEIRFKDQPEQRLGLLEAVGSQLPFFGDYEGSLVVTRRYLALLKAMKSDEWRVLRAHLGIARALVNLNQLSAAEQTLREALASVPDVPGAVNNRVAVMAELGKTLTRLAKREEARQVLAAAVQRLPEFNDGSIRWDVRSTLARLSLGFDDPAALALMSAAHEEYRRFPQAQSAETGASFLYLGAALSNVGRRAEAERALAEAERRFVEVYGKVDRDTVLAAGRLASAMASQGRYVEARQLLAQRRAEVEAQRGPDTAGALATLTARQLQTALMHGDLQSAARFAATEDAAALSTPAARDTVLHTIGIAQYLRWSGRPGEAVQLLERWLGDRPPAQRWTGESFDVGIALASARLALDRPRQALDGLLELNAAMRTQRATRTWAMRQVIALTALARSRLGAPAEAVALLATADQYSEGMLPPSMAGQADQAAVRAQVLHAAGRPAEAAAALNEMRANLQHQHPESPRLLESQRLAGILRL